MKAQNHDLDHARRKEIRVLAAGVLSSLLLVESGFCTAADSLRFQTSDFMKTTAYLQPRRVAAKPDPAGAYSPVNIQWDHTHQGSWYVEEQRYGGDAICAGIAGHDPESIDRGLKILRWGFQQQQPDGSFACPDDFHSTSFFVEAAAHSCLLLKASSYGEQYSAEIAWMKPRILKAAQWMTKPEVESIGKKRNAPYTHRRYLVAAALGEAGVLNSDPALIDKSKEYIQEGIRLQDPSGFNPEKGGADASYDAAGLFYAERYYDLVADDQTKHDLLPMLKKGYAWLQNQVAPDGTISTSGNTRIGSVPEQSRNATAKKVNYGVIYQGFYHWSLISGDPAFDRLAEKVFSGAAIYKRQFSKH